MPNSDARRLLRIACVQMRSGLDVAENIATASDLIRQAAAQGAELVATPEMTSLMDQSPGGTYARSSCESWNPALQAFRDLARELGVWLLIGSLPIKVEGGKLEAGRCANRSFLIDPAGAITARYDKIHRFDAQLGAGNAGMESRDYTAGEEAVVAATPLAMVGMTVCYDVRFPHLHRDLAKAGAEIIASPAAFTRVSGEAHWHVLLRARAIETGSFVIAPAQGGKHEDGRETYGHSLIVGPWGEIIAEAGVDPGVIVATIDLDDVARARGRIPALEHDRGYRIVRAETVGVKEPA